MEAKNQLKALKDYATENLWREYEEAIHFPYDLVEKAKDMGLEEVAEEMTRKGDIDSKQFKMFGESHMDRIVEAIRPRRDWFSV